MREEKQESKEENSMFLCSDRGQDPPKLLSGHSFCYSGLAPVPGGPSNGMWHQVPHKPRTAAPEHPELWVGSELLLAPFLSTGKEKGAGGVQGRGQDAVGKPSVDSRFLLLSADPPYISDAKSTGVPVGQKGILLCEASAVPSADFQWYKDDKR